MYLFINNLMAHTLDYLLSFAYQSYNFILNEEQNK